MKKQNISVTLFLMGNSVAGGGNAAYDQLLAHRDIVDNFIPGVGDEDDPAKYIYPYHAVNYAIITRESETVEAPTDAFCGGAGVLEVKILDEIPAEAGQVAGTPPDCFLSTAPLGMVESITYNGEEVSVMDFAQAIADGKASIASPGWVWTEDFDFIKPGWDCSDEGGEMTINITFTYMGASTTVTVTFPYTNDV